MAKVEVPINNVPTRYYRAVEPMSVKKGSGSYRNSPHLLTIISRIASDVANFDFQVSKETANALNLRQILIVRPSVYYTPIEFWTEVVKRMLTDDEVAVYIARKKDGTITFLDIADSFELNPSTGKYTLHLANGEDRELKATQFLKFKNPRGEQGLWSKKYLNLITTQLDQLEDELINQKQINLLITQPGNSRQNADLKAYHQERATDIIESSVGGIGFLEQGEQATQINSNKVGLSTDTFDALNAELYKIFGISKAIMSGDFSEEQLIAYLGSTIDLYTNVLEQELNKKLLDANDVLEGKGIKLVHNVTKFMSAKDKFAAVDKMTYYGNMSGNEDRALFGLPPVDGLNTYLGNLNQTALVTNDGTKVDPTTISNQVPTQTE